MGRLVYLAGTGIADGWKPGYRREVDRRLHADLPRIQALEGRPRTEAEDRELAVLQWSADFADRDRAREWAEALATPWFGVNWECNRLINAEQKETSREAELAAACRRLPVPTLILDGAQDPRPRWAVDTLAAALPDVTRVTLDGVGHLPWVEAPDDVAAALCAFLTEPR